MGCGYSAKGVVVAVAMKNRFPESKRAKRIRELEERRLQKTEKPEVVLCRFKDERCKHVSAKDDDGKRYHVCFRSSEDGKLLSCCSLVPAEFRASLTEECLIKFVSDGSFEWVGKK